MKAQLVILVLAAIITLPSFAAAQITFERWYGGTSSDNGYSVAQTSIGGYIIAGETDSYGADSFDIFLVKTDSVGDTSWTRTYGGDSVDVGYYVQQTLDGGYIIAGYTSSYGPGGGAVYLIKTDSFGDTSWTRTYGGTYWEGAYSAAQTSDTGYIITGWTYSYGAGWTDVYLIKTDFLGDTLWTRTYGTASWEWGNSVAQTSDGGYIIAGYTESYGVGGDVYLIKTDANGDILWTTNYGGGALEEGYSVAQTQDGGYIIAGETWSYGAGMYDVYLIKADSLGDTLWTRTYGGDFEDVGYSVAQTQDGGYIIAGRTESYGAGLADIYLIKTDSNGDILWTKTFGGTSNEVGQSLAQTYDGGYIIAGWTGSYGSGPTDVYLIKTDSLGNVAVEEEKEKKQVIRDLVITISPNPFTTVARIEVLGASKNQKHNLSIYEVSGRRVRKISLLPFSFYLGATWDGCDENGNMVAPGVYFLKANGKYVGKVVKVR